MKKNKNKKSYKFAALQEHESAAFHLGFQQGFVWNFNRVRTNVKFSVERTYTIQLFHSLRYEKNKKKKSFKFAALQVKMKMLQFFWGFNGVSSETSNVYVRTYNFRPNELER
jgi:hypothetical protein